MTEQSESINLLSPTIVDLSGTCDLCGLDHKSLGVTIDKGILLRQVKPDSHLVHCVESGAWAFNATLIDRHTDIDHIVCEDSKTQTFWLTTRQEMLLHGFRRTLNPQYGVQLILPLPLWLCYQDTHIKKRTKRIRIR